MIAVLLVACQMNVNTCIMVSEYPDLDRCLSALHYLVQRKPDEDAKFPLFCKYGPKDFTR